MKIAPGRIKVAVWCSKELGGKQAPAAEAAGGDESQEGQEGQEGPSAKRERRAAGGRDKRRILKRL